MNRMELFLLLSSVAMSVAPLHGGPYWARTLGAALGDKPLHACMPRGFGEIAPKPKQAKQGGNGIPSRCGL